MFNPSETDLLTAGDLIVMTIIGASFVAQESQPTLVVEVSPQDFKNHSTGVSEVLLLRIGGDLIETSLPVCPGQSSGWQRVSSWRELA